MNSDVKAKYLAKLLANKPEPKITGYGVFSVNGKEYSAEGIALAWVGKQSWAGFEASNEWTVTFPDGSQLVFDPHSELARNGSHEVLTQCAFPD